MKGPREFDGFSMQSPGVFHGFSCCPDMWVGVFMSRIVMAHKKAVRFRTDYDFEHFVHAQWAEAIVSAVWKPLVQVVVLCCCPFQIFQQPASPV